MTQTRHWTSADLEQFPDDGKRYEIIAGELFVSKQPAYGHQRTCARFCAHLDRWSEETGLGEVSIAPGLIFADDDDAAPDVVWVSRERLAAIIGSDGKLHGAPELVIEVLSPGATNTRRDRQVKLDLYNRRGVEEYWVADWQRRRVEVYRRVDGRLTLVATLREDDILESPLLPGFSCRVADLFPRGANDLSAASQA